MKIKQQLNRYLMQQTGSAIKSILSISGFLAIAFIITATLYLNQQTSDTFNYADESSVQLTENRDQWSSIEWLEPIDIILDQSQAVFYWQSNNELSWKCNSKDGIDQGPAGEIVIRHNNCLLYLPLQIASIKTIQSDLVLVRPQANTQIEISQTTLRIAENENSYLYDIEAKNSDIDKFKSVDNAKVRLTIFAVESEVSDY